jgi:hypothetical protein
VVVVNLRVADLIAFAAISLSAGCSLGDSESYGSYDECILKAASGAPNADAVNLMKDSCFREFSISKEIDLQVTESLNSDRMISVSNRTDYIVTQFSVDAGELGEWEQVEWIEPHGWVDSETPDGRLDIVKAAKERKIKAKSIRVIETGKLAKD